MVGAQAGTRTGGLDDMTETTRPRTGMWLGLAAIVLIVVAMVVVFSSGFGKDPSLIASPLIGKPAPQDSMSYLNQDGTLSLADMEGEVLVVNFFASWCFPCRQEHPVLEQAAASYADQPVRFVGVVYQDEPAQAITFLDQYGWAEGTQYAIDPESRVAIDFGVYGVPETFFISPEGIIMAKKTGPLSAFEVSNTIDTLLAGGTPGDLNEGQTQSS
jgi:cytochrome c biogenesis protein CcmG/thiol:disulfide interchange protein DsbE